MSKKSFTLILFLITLILLISSCGKSNEEIISDEVNQMKPMLPLKNDDYIALVDVKAGNDEIIYVYELSDIGQNIFDSTNIPLMKPIIIEFFKTKKNMEDIFKRNITLKIMFMDQIGYEVSSFSISKNDMDN